MNEIVKYRTHIAMIILFIAAYIMPTLSMDAVINGGEHLFGSSTNFDSEKYSLDNIKYDQPIFILGMILSLIAGIVILFKSKTFSLVLAVALVYGGWQIALALFVIVSLFYGFLYRGIYDTESIQKNIFSCINLAIVIYLFNFICFGMIVNETYSINNEHIQSNHIIGNGLSDACYNKTTKGSSYKYENLQIKKINCYYDKYSTSKNDFISKSDSFFLNSIHGGVLDFMYFSYLVEIEGDNPDHMVWFYQKSFEAVNNRKDEVINFRNEMLDTYVSLRGFAIKTGADDYNKSFTMKSSDFIAYINSQTNKPVFSGWLIDLKNKSSLMKDSDKISTISFKRMQSLYDQYQLKKDTVYNEEVIGYELSIPNGMYFYYEEHFKHWYVHR